MFTAFKQQAINPLNPNSDWHQISPNQFRP